jgi:hypothetical protein
MATHLPAGRTLRRGVVGLVAAAALTACGGSDGVTVVGSATPSNGPAGMPGGGQGRGFDPARMQQIEECLAAAGISLPTPTGGFRTFNPSERERPTWTRTGRPSGAPAGGQRGGAGRGMFTDPKIRAALEACGIPLPTRRPAGSAGDLAPAPTATG